jgi:hypothetical protein
MTQPVSAVVGARCRPGLDERCPVRAVSTCPRSHRANSVVNTLRAGPGWMSIVLYELSARAPDLTEPDLANVLWALATLQHQPPRQLLNAFLVAVGKLALSMSAQVCVCECV